MPQRDRNESLLKVLEFVTETKRQMANYTIGEICKSELIEVANLVAKAVPNAIISKLGNKFGAIFYSKVVEQEYSCGYVARDESDNILGVIIGTADHPKARSIAFKGQLAKLLLAANFRLLSWSVISWLVKGIVTKIRGKKQEHTDTPVAELIVITIHPKARGTGLAKELVKKMEKFMISKGLRGPYTILTEKANTRANRFYEKIGATFVRTNLHHERKINEWHKEITSARGDG